MEMKFVTEPDETGKGRIIVDGRYYGLPVRAVEQLEVAYDIKQLTEQFIMFLDIVEQTDEGREFHPNTLSSCRVLDCKRMNEILVEIKEKLNEKKS